MNAPYRLDASAPLRRTGTQNTRSKSVWEQRYGGVNGARVFARIRRQHNEISWKSPLPPLAGDIAKFSKSGVNAS
jgi:hypothetical protein